jgi:putative hydrolases of HD superfamily
LKREKLQPLLHNYVTGGGSWKRHGIKRHQVEARMQPVSEGSTQLSELIQDILDDAVKKEILAG